MQLTIPEAAQLLRTTAGQVRRWIRDEGLPAVSFDEQLRLNRVALQEWAQRRGLALLETPDDAGDAEDLARALERGGIHRGVFGSSLAEVVEQAIACLRLPPTIDGELLRAMLRARADHGATAIGNGIALPHTRYPIVADVPRPILGLCFLAAPVAPLAPGGEPIGILFVLVSPSVRVHLRMLAGLARALVGGLRERIDARADDAQILAFCKSGAAGGTGRTP